jgi:hypothetical protein
MAQKDEMNRAWDEWADRANPPMRTCVACGLTGDSLVEIVLTAGTTRIMNGSIANSVVAVNAGGVLGGTGTLGSTTINGGTLSPGNSPGNSIGTITVNGSLMLSAAASYLIEVSPTAADRTNVTGAATLAGTVTALFTGGTYMTRTYTILSAAGGRSGTFGGLTTSGLPAGFTVSLSYTSTDAILNLVATLGSSGLSINQQNVAGALNNFFNNGGTLPANFLPIFNLTGANLGNALSQLSGEAATGAQQVGFQMTNQFLGLMLDPFVDGRSGVAGTGGPALGFAPEREEATSDDVALAYSSVLKAPPMKALAFEQRWAAWGGAYGGSNSTSGDPAVLGSHDLAARTAGFAGGFDYHLSRDSVVAPAPSDTLGNAASESPRSASGKRVYRLRDKPPKFAFRPETVSAETETQPQEPADCGPLASFREIFRFERLRGGPGRIRTSNQTVMSTPPLARPTSASTSIGFAALVPSAR